MRIDDQDKLIKAGFCIIRKDDYPGPRIKMCTGINGGWKTYKKFETKAERDRTFALLAEFFNELADWAYANGEAMLIDDEPEKQDDYEDR
jgi:hypothetical protein